MKTLKNYIELLEGEVTPGLLAVGVSEPETTDPIDVEISFKYDAHQQPIKSVHASADKAFGGNPEVMRKVLHDMGVPIPDEGDKPNETEVWVTVSGNGDRVTAIADDEKADELLDVLKNAGLYKDKGNNDA